ncbi:unnamed protein product [Mycena citricolor]|uniref:Uncharacterized protein n=1 Tax=Mycena citricolor TaxID=2018698 RepID=A0AAD2I235_9AGAR|nr:unnamed protein product [Mycena citricolor]
MSDNAPESPTPTSFASADEVGALRSEVSVLSGQFAQLLARMNAAWPAAPATSAPAAAAASPAAAPAAPPAAATGSTSAAAPASTPAVAPASTASFVGFAQAPSFGALGTASFGTAPAHQFAPPLPPLDSPAGAHPSLRSLFPDVEPAVILAVLSHELKAQDLYKLDARVNELDATFTLNASGVFERNVAGHKQYATPATVIHPLHVYFSILAAHLSSGSAVPADIRMSASTYFHHYALGGVRVEGSPALPRALLQPPSR